MEYIIRKLTFEDVNNTISLMCYVFDQENIFLNYRHDKLRESFDEAFLSDNENLNAKYFIAENKHEIIGVGGIKMSYISDNVFELCWLTVHNKYRNCGIGTSLVETRIDYAIQEAKKNGDDKIHILTGTRVPNMFKRLGFSEFMCNDGNDFFMNKTIEI